MKRNLQPEMVEETEFQPALNVVKGRDPRQTPRRVPLMTVVQNIAGAIRPELVVLGWEARAERLHGCER